MKKITGFITVLGLGWFGISPSVQAEEKGFEVQELRLGVGVASERWSEPFLLQVYGKSGKLLPNVSMSYRFHKNFSLDVEAGRGRLTANDERQVFQVVPVSIGGSVLFGDQNVEPFVSLGAGFVQFSEKLTAYERGAPSAIYGTKVGVDSKAGLRIGTRMVQDSQHPGAPQSFSQMDVELFMGYRVHQAFGVGTGLNMNAFRTGVALKFRL